MAQQQEPCQGPTIPHKQQMPFSPTKHTCTEKSIYIDISIYIYE